MLQFLGTVEFTPIHKEICTLVDLYRYKAASSNFLEGLNTKCKNKHGTILPTIINIEIFTPNKQKLYNSVLTDTDSGSVQLHE